MSSSSFDDSGEMRPASEIAGNPEPADTGASDYSESSEQTPFVQDQDLHSPSASGDGNSDGAGGNGGSANGNSAPDLEALNAELLAAAELLRNINGNPEANVADLEEERPPQQNAANEYVTLGMLFRTPTFSNIYLAIPVVLALTVGLIMDFKSKCEVYSTPGPESSSTQFDNVMDLSSSQSSVLVKVEEFHSFKSWTISFLIINFLMFFVNAALVARFIRNPQEMNRTSSNCMTTVGFLFTLAWFIAFIIGAVRTFALRKDPCHGDIPFLYNISFWIVIFGFVSIGIFILVLLFICCLCCVCMGFGRRRLRNLGPQGTDENLISTFPKMKYEEGMDLNGTDPTCTICQGDYIAQEELTFLPCGHHFHSECITPWLRNNRICPICKRDVTNPEVN